MPGGSAGAPRERRAAPRRHRRGEGARLRAGILDAATELVDEGGEPAVTLRAVARRAGIAATSVRPHFPDRQAVLRAVAGQARDEVSARIGAAVAAEDDAERRLYAACRAYLGFASAHPLRYRALFCPAGALGGAPVAFADRLAGSFAEVLAGCVAAGRSTSTDPRADAFALWLGLHGLAHRRSLGHLRPEPVRLAPRLVAALSHLSAPAPAPPDRADDRAGRVGGVGPISPAGTP